MTEPNTHEEKQAKMFLAVTCASRNTTVQVFSIVSLSRHEGDAAADCYRQLYEKFPPSEGWLLDTPTCREIDPSLIRKAVASLPDPRDAELSALTHALGLSHARVAELEADSAGKLKLVTEWRECLDRRTAENDALREKLSALRKQLEESDASDAAYAQGFGAASKNCPMEDNPYDAGKPQAEECAIAWATGWLDRMWQVRAERAESRAERAERELSVAQTAARQAGVEAFLAGVDEMRRQVVGITRDEEEWCRGRMRNHDGGEEKWREGVGAALRIRRMIEIRVVDVPTTLLSLPAPAPATGEQAPAETPEALCVCGHPKSKHRPNGVCYHQCGPYLTCNCGKFEAFAPPVAPSAPAATGEQNAREDAALDAIIASAFLDDSVPQSVEELQKYADNLSPEDKAALDAMPPWTPAQETHSPSASATDALNCPCPSGCCRTPHCVGKCQEQERSAPSPMETHAANAMTASGDAERRVLAKPVKFSTRGDDVKVPPMGLLNRAAEKFGDDGTAPDAFWWKDFFNLTGEHMICTQEDGWVDGSAKGEYLPDDILDEVNAQPTPAPSQDAEQTPVKGVDREARNVPCSAMSPSGQACDLRAGHGGDHVAEGYEDDDYEVWSNPPKAASSPSAPEAPEAKKGGA